MQTPKKVNRVENGEDPEDPEEYQLLHLDCPRKNRPLKVEVDLDDQHISMELDTGAAFSLVSELTFKELWPDSKLSETQVRLHSYSGETIPVLGSKAVLVKYKDQVARLPLLVVKGAGPTLFGRNWLNCLKLNWQEINCLYTGELQAILQKHSAVFDSGLGTLKGFKAKISIDADAKPRFCKARSVPYSLREKVEAELEHLVDEGTLEPVQFSDWAAPIVAVLKADKKNVRICGDFKQTVNPVSKLDKYPIPKVEDLFAQLSGGKTFTKLDLSQAYQQVLLDDNSKQYVVINTQKGLFRYTRLPFGISSAPGIFQRVMENLLKGIPGVVVYLDDILVTGATQEKHLQALEEVLSRLENAGLLVKRKKCQFMAPSVTYLGHRIDSEGLHPLTEKVRAIKEAPPPRSVTELKSYLGLLTYYGKFFPNMSTVLAPLYKLLRKDVQWYWKEEEAKAFEVSKKLLTSSDLLVHFNPKLKIVLACDASSYGVGAVLAHKMPDGSERPIGYASRSLSPAERNYSQLEREGLACIFGIKRFHSYLFGHHFELITDNKPLLALLHEHKATSEQASARIRRWSLLLSMYEYTIQFRKTQAHGNADALSRLPLPDMLSEVPTPVELVLLLEHLDDSPVTAQQVRTWTRKDPILATVLQYVRQGWPERCEEKLAPYSSKKNELSVYEGCVLWGSRVVLPPKARKIVLMELHQGHPGMTRMKALARMYVWWPGLEKDIETRVNSCIECQMLQSTPPVAPLHPWKWPTRPWARLHIDFAGPIFGKMFLVVIDAHSKWIECFATNSSTSTVVIEHLRTVFAQFGLPETIVSDNGSCFVSEEFNSFLLANGVKLVNSAPYHPASNGLAERAVQIIKKGLKKVTDGSIQSRIARVLFSYRITPQSTTGVSPAELLLGRQPRTRLDLLKPNTADRVESKQQQQKSNHDSSSRNRLFAVGDKVYAKNFGQGQRWLPSLVTEVTGPVSCMVTLEDGRIIRRHQDHLRIRKNDSHSPTPPESTRKKNLESIPLEEIPLTIPDPTTSGSEESSPTVELETFIPTQDFYVEPSTETTPAENMPQGAVESPPQDSPPARKTYPRRDRKPPDRFSGNETK